MLNFYRTTLRIALAPPRRSCSSRLLATIGLNYYMFRYQMTYGLFPVQDTGLIIGSIQADQSISFQSMQKKLQQLQTIVQDDPAVASVVGFTGGRQTNSGFVYLSLKPFSERKDHRRRRRDTACAASSPRSRAPVSSWSRSPICRTGGRQSNATYQYTLLSDDTSELYKWAPKLTAALMNSDVIKDVNSDQQQGGLETDVTIDRDTAMRLGLTLNAIDNTLYDAFGQRQVSTIYSAQNQYHVVMEVAPRYWQDPRTLDELYVSTSGANPTGTQQTGIAAGIVQVVDWRCQHGGDDRSGFGAQSRDQRACRERAYHRLGRRRGLDLARDDGPALRLRPFRARTHAAQRQSSGTVRGLDDFVQSRLRPCAERSENGDRERDPPIGMPSTVRGAFAGTAATYQQSQSNMPLLFGAALLTIYIVLGILYESLIHPITILSTLFSASVGAALALWLFDTQFTVIAAIGVLLLIGIVKKNAIMMVDFALDGGAAAGSIRARRSSRLACCASGPS